MILQRNTDIQMQELDTESATVSQEYLTLLADLNRQYGRISTSMMSEVDHSDIAAFSLSIATLFANAAFGNALDPEKFVKTQAAALNKFASLAQYTVEKMNDGSPKPIIVPSTDDSRFRSQQWTENLWFDVMKQSYLIGSEYLQGIFGANEKLSQQEKKKLDFYLNQWTDSMSPTNFAFTNPDVLEQARKTKGRSLVKGLENFANDIEAGRGVKMVESEAFELGRNIATTPGMVIARNRLAELIQYSPTTDQVYSRPVMIIPPWINKYYILDLSEKNSFIRWLVSQGYTVFVISWVNPDESFRYTGFDDYVDCGPLWASEIIRSITSEEKINAIGYCLGGTLLASALGYLESAQDEKNFISSATFFATMIDFAEPGDLGVFVDEATVSQLEKTMNEKGYLDGKSMASTFNMMRSNDLIWHFVINNYLLGKSPGSFDLLFWNSDSTRMPAEMHTYYLRKMYIENLLSQPNRLNILGNPIDLSKVKIPTFFASTQLDHIAPWRSTYSGAKLFSGKTRFLLGESGHIAGIINPPKRKKYGYWTSAQLPENADQWLDQARYREGSWWPEWEKWIRRYSGDQETARQPGSEQYQPLCVAPGDYVKL